MSLCANRATSTSIGGGEEEGDGGQPEDADGADGADDADGADGADDAAAAGREESGGEAAAEEEEIEGLLVTTIPLVVDVGC